MHSSLTGRVAARGRGLERRRLLMVALGTIALAFGGLMGTRQTVNPGESRFLYGPANAAHRRFPVQPPELSTGIPERADYVPPRPEDLERELNWNQPLARVSIDRPVQLTSSGVRPPAGRPRPEGQVSWSSIPTGNMVVRYTGWRQRLSHWHAQFSCSLHGILLPTNAIPLAVALAFYEPLQMFPPTNTVYHFAGRLDPMATLIYPVVTSNQAGIRPTPVTLSALLASNGLTIVRVRRDAVKIYPTDEADRYAKAPLP